MLSIIHLLLLPRHYTSIIQCRCYFTHTTFTSTCQQNRSIWCDFLRHFVIHKPLVISTPFVPTAIKLFFPRRFSLSAPLTTQTKSLPPSHKMSSIYFNYIIPATFAKIVIQLPTSTPLRLTSTPPSLIDFRPTIPYFNFNYLDVISV